MSGPTLHTFPLSMASSGELLSIVSHYPGRGIEKRLSDLGLHLGSVVEVVQQQGPGGLVVARDGGRIALGRGVAHKIMVTPVESRETERQEKK